MWKYFALKMYRDLTNNQYQECQKGKSSFHCKHCTVYQCVKCNKHFYDHITNVSVLINVIGGYT